MSSMIDVLSKAMLLVRDTQDLLFRQADHQDGDIDEAIQNLDHLVSIIHGLREEEREIARFESGFRGTGLEEIDLIDDEEEEERLREYIQRRESNAIEWYDLPDVPGRSD